jgi:hypothetical protein
VTRTKLFGSLDLDDVLKSLADIAVDVLGADKSMVSISDPVRGGFVPTAWRNMSEETLSFYRGVRRLQTLELSDGGLVAFEDLDQADPEFRDVLMKEGMVSTLNVPILFEGRVSGAFGLAWSKTHRFSDQEKRLVLALAQRARRGHQQRWTLRARPAGGIAGGAAASGTRTARLRVAGPVRNRPGGEDGAHPARARPFEGRGAAGLCAVTGGGGAGGDEGFDFRTAAGVARTEGLVAALEKRAAATQANTDVQMDLCGDRGWFEVKEAAYPHCQRLCTTWSSMLMLECRAEARARRLELGIADDSAVSSRRSVPDRIGLQSMRERAASGGSLEIASKPGKGTTVSAYFPIGGTL